MGNRQTWKITSLLGGTMLAIFAIVLVVNSYALSDRTSAQNSTKSVTIHVSGALEALTNEQLVKEADLVVLGRVLGSPRVQWNTSSGRLPSEMTALDAPADFWVYTDTNIQVDQYLKGTSLGNMLQVRTHGGRLPDVTMIVEDAGELREGQNVLLFLTQKYKVDGDIGTEHYWVVGAYQGAFEVVGNEAIRGEERFSLAELLALVTRSQQ